MGSLGASRKRERAEANADSSQQLPQHRGLSEKKRKREFRYGNYNRYYGYRVGKTIDEDPRLKWFRKEWFEGKECLDVGCNEGYVTLAVAQKFSCRSILGVDIDRDLIRKASKTLQQESASGDSQSDCLHEGRHVEGRICNPCYNINKSAREKNQASTHTDEVSGCSCPESLQKRVKFKAEQFIEDFPHGEYRKDGLFDTVLCLSVTKWIHLNWGDEGLIRLFAKIHHILRPGGLFILEPQPWKSYQSKCHVSEVTRRYFKEIQIFPQHFKHVLLDKIGFKSVEEISKAVPNSRLGFKRPLSLYVK